MIEIILTALATVATFQLWRIRIVLSTLNKNYCEVEIARSKRKGD